jgi:ribonuclease BN (tRNA processing enzyme)
MAKFPIENRTVLEPGRTVAAGPFRLTTATVLHSVRCPGIGVRLEVEGRILVYSGDLVSFEDPEAALDGAEIYVGDGSTLTGSLVRRHSSGALLGHTTIRAQLGWLAKRKVGRAVFSHFGSEAIAMGEEALSEALAKLGSERLPGGEVTAARDGRILEL